MNIRFYNGVTAEITSHKLCAGGLIHVDINHYVEKDKTWEDFDKDLKEAFDDLRNGIVKTAMIKVALRNMGKGK